MTLKLQVVIVIGLIGLLIAIVNMVRRRQLELKYVLIWLGCDLALIILACFPWIMDEISRSIGIFAPTNMIFFLGFVFLLLIIFSLTVALSRVTTKMRRIAQEVAILSEELRKSRMEQEAYREQFGNVPEDEKAPEKAGKN